ncbi:MAG: lipoyl(octanoyl) transferase [Bacteroidetes bacterium MED-G20]|nr:MAG: lipoyl(octanoyl) transferase [Bacteroidetes bacterium MED-G20]|tara:strand:+ start:16746 stop:17453 length:708 start_codon:yes stop_codon:yes gene_type:complete
MNLTGVHFMDLGLIEYQKCWDFQTKLFDETVQLKIRNRKTPQKLISTKNHLIFCEHPHVYTLGKSGDESNLLINQKEQKVKKVTFFKTNRGGDITYHGPGQLVVYPILDLDYFFSDIHKYLRFLEESVMMTLKDYGIIAKRLDGLTGVWVANENGVDRKICAIGVKSSRWVTMHGIGFNINSDLSYFNNIIPCGIEDKSVTSLQNELGREVDMNELKNRFKNNFSSIFKVELINN